MNARNQEPNKAPNDTASSDIFASAESKRDYNRHLFSTVAPRYTTATRVLSFGRDQAWKRDLLQECEHRFSGAQAPGGDAQSGQARSGAGMRILDLACGTGDLTLALAERFPQAEILGVDLNPEMLAEAERRLQSEHGNVRFVEADMGSLPYEANQFTLITAGYALRNAPDLSHTLQEISRVLQPNGLLAILEFSRSPVPALSCISISLLRFWGSLWGLLLHGDASVYGYIARSLAHYPDRMRFNELLSEYGFNPPDRRLRMFGLLELCFTHGTAR